jgi:hypothetical protein
MKPMGQKPIRHNLPDNHCRRGGKRVGNWWEDEQQRENKAAERRDAKRDMKREIDEEHRTEQ